MAAQYHLKDICLALRVPRSSFYAWRSRTPSRRHQQNLLLKDSVQKLFFANRQVYGSPRITACLKKDNFPCSRNRVAKQMRQLGLKARQKRAFRPKTTNSNHPNPIAPNHLAKAPKVNRP